MNKEIIIDNIQIIFEETTPRKFIELGYELKSFEQIIEEPTLAGCILWKDDRQVAFLYFYNIKEIIEINKLYDIPIDFAHIDTKPVKVIKFSLKQKLLYNILIHLFSIVVFCLMSLSKSLIENNEGLGLILLCLPTLICTTIWANDLADKKGHVFKKILVCISAFLNLFITIVIYYLIFFHFIDNI